MSAKQSVSELIAALSSGDFDALTTRELNKVVEAVEAGHGTGKLTITIAFKKENRMVVAKPTVKATVPTGAVDASMFFVDKSGRLTEEDPKQVTMSFPRPASKLVKLDGGAGEHVNADEKNEKKGN